VPIIEGNPEKNHDPGYCQRGNREDVTALDNRMSTHSKPLPGRHVRPFLK
jgi:hypothetical protein